ncbi:uncharacterized protein LOC143904381 isoform X1 [Temnothorax americanus]|uniref:uncharacterized protein LOC143904381 isoform X1 n=1 Tax=Temnothorax americanus TaxID=1964332 RepID=UPI004068272B
MLFHEYREQVPGFPSFHVRYFQSVKHIFRGSVVRRDARDDKIDKWLVSDNTQRVSRVRMTKNDSRCAVERPGPGPDQRRRTDADGRGGWRRARGTGPDKPKAGTLLAGTMSTVLSNEAQLRYVIEWFQEWSEMQRNDFLGVLLENCGPSGLVNGLVAGIEKLGCEGSDRPPSLFQCRVKLFREWSSTWSQCEKDSLLAAIKSTDSKFAEKYEERLSSLTEDK